MQEQRFQAGALIAGKRPGIVAPKLPTTQPISGIYGLKHRFPSIPIAFLDFFCKAPVRKEFLPLECPFSPAPPRLSALPGAQTKEALPEIGKGFFENNPNDPIRLS
jgi:hypothetical protein